MVVADAGVDALVLQVALRGVETREADGAVEVTAAAGEPWDELVRQTRSSAAGAGSSASPAFPGWWAPRPFRTWAPTART